MAWMQLMMVLILGAGGWWLGWKIGSRNWWWVGFVVPMVVVALVFLGHRSVKLSFMAPISWAVDARLDPPLMAATATVMFATLIVKLPVRRTRLVVSTLAAFMVMDYGLLPIAMPLVVRGALLSQKTRVDEKGICLQAHAYTCGPASAVTCLKLLGTNADEGLLAAESQCGPLVGTDGHMLARAITALYGERGITAAYRHVERLEDLTTPAVANMWMKGVGGHFVAVLQVTPGDVVVGDPLSGEYAMTRAEFVAAWQGAAVEFGKDGTAGDRESSKRAR